MPGLANESGRLFAAGLRRLSARLGREDGFTLVEMLSVMVLLGILLSPIITSLVATMSAQARQASAVTAQEQARLALERMRLDIHCAHSVAAPFANTSGGTTILLNETNTSGVAECPGLLAQNAYSVQWCTVPYPGSTTRYRLFREDDVNVACSGSVSTFQVDYLSQPSVWTTPGCTGGAVPTVTVALSVDVSPGTTAAGSYDLDDQIALRNATPCT
jgi:prepilin-type N-terminal cleavage/methylation domain-containing protein